MVYAPSTTERISRQLRILTKRSFHLLDSAEFAVESLFNLTKLRLRVKERRFLTFRATRRTRTSPTPTSPTRSRTRVPAAVRPSQCYCSGSAPSCLARFTKVCTTQVSPSTRMTRQTSRVCGSDAVLSMTQKSSRAIAHGRITRYGGNQAYDRLPGPSLCPSS